MLTYILVLGLIPVMGKEYMYFLPYLIYFHYQQKQPYCASEADHYSFLDRFCITFQVQVRVLIKIMVRFPSFSALCEPKLIKILLDINLWHFQEQKPTQ